MRFLATFAVAAALVPATFAATCKEVTVDGVLEYSITATGLADVDETCKKFYANLSVFTDCSPPTGACGGADGNLAAAIKVPGSCRTAAFEEAWPEGTLSCSG